MENKNSSILESKIMIFYMAMGLHPHCADMNRYTPYQKPGMSKDLRGGFGGSINYASGHFLLGTAISHTEGTREM
jgi:hypothetical protein